MSTEQKDYNLSPKEFARLVGVSSSTVRRWEEENVFTSVRTTSGYRKFALSDVPRAKEYKRQVSALKKQKSQNHIYSKTANQVSAPRHSRIAQFIFERAALLSVAVLAIIITASAIVTYPALKGILSSNPQAKSQKAKSESPNSKYPDATDVNVLAAESSKLARSIISNIGWNFKATVQIEDLQVNGPSVFLADIDAQGQNLNLGTGRIAASNVLYGIQAGEGISIAGQTQTPLITNIDPGSAQKIFKNIKVGSNTITAETNTDTITFEQGSGITLSVDGKKITIASSQSGYSYWSTEVDGVSYDNIEDGAAVNFVSGDDITVTRSAANELTFNLQDVIDTVTGIDLTAGGYLNGTNATITFDNFSVDASGNIRIAAGSDFYIGSVNLGSTGLSSGASLVGVDGTNISQSASGDLQTVLENMSAAMGSGSSKWTIASNVIYPNNYSTVDFSLGGTSPSSAPFGMDIAQNILYLGDGANDANTPTIYFKASDGTNSGTLSYADSDRFVFTGGDVVVDGVIYAGSGVQQITLANGLLNPSALPLITSGTSPTTNSISGFEVISNQIGLIRGCSNGEVLKWNSGTARWTCSPDSSGVSGVVDVQQDGATPPGSVDSQFDTINFVNNFNLSENSSGVIDVDLGSNIGIGTAPSGSYALTVNGATNTSTLYLSGTQVTASANEINLLTGRTGTLLDTNNVASQLSAWDQNASDDVTAFTGLSDTPSSYAGQAAKVVRVNAGGTGLEFIDPSAVGTNYWGRNSGSGYVYPAVVTDKVGIGNTSPTESLDVTGNIAVSGTVDGRDISADGSNLDMLYTTIGLSALTSGEVDQLENIGSTTISSTQWGYLGSLNQGLSTTDAATFTTINTGQGAYELYAMDQNVRTSDTVQFAGLQIGGATPTVSSIVSGTGTDWSGAVDTALATQLAIKSYVDSQIGGAANTFENGLSESGNTVTLGGALNQSTRLYDGSYEYLYMNTSTGNVGIGTTTTSTYKLNVGGSFNTTGLYLSGSQVTSDASELNLLDGVNLTLTATEFNLLDGRSGTLLDTNNVATQLSAWDQDSSNDLITTDIGSTVQGYNANTSFLGQTIESSEITDGTITGGDISDSTIGNVKLANSSVTITAGTGLSGGGAVSLGSSVTLNSTLGTSIETGEITDGTVLPGDIDDNSQTPTDGQVLTYNNANSKFNWVDATSLGTNYWGRNSGSGYVYPAVVTDKVGIGNTSPTESLDVTGNIAVSGTVDGRDISADGSNLDTLYTTIGLSALTSGEVDQLENIGATTVSATQWGYLGAMDQSLSTTDAATFTTINTGQGAYELYAMDQNVRTSDTVQFAGLQIGGATPTVSSIVSGTGTDWSGAVDTEVVTRLAIKSYVDSQVSGSAQNIWSTITSQSGSTSANTTSDTLTVNGSGSISTSISGDTLTITGTDNDTTYSAGSGLSLASTTFSLGGQITQNTRLYDGSYEYLYMNTSTGNVGIGTTTTSTYKLNVGGSFNTTGLYLSGSQVTSDASELNLLDGVNLTLTATEFNLLDGRSGTLLDTNNVATQLSAWDQDSSNDALITSLTSGYLPYFNGTNLANSVAYLTGGNIGIGTTAPNAKLEVAGNIVGSTLSDGTISITGGDITGAGNITAGGIITGTGSGLTGLNASNLASGTVPSARISGNYSGITGVGTITSGTWQGSVISSTYLDSAVILATEIDTYTELNAIVSDVTLTHNGLIDTSSEIAGIVGDETGSGALVFAGSPTFSGDISFPGGLWSTTGNVGIGTTSAGTYKLDVNGSFNSTSLYLSGTQVTSTASELNLLDGVNLTLSAAEFNLLDGRSGTLLDTNNVATQLSAWDQDSSNDALITSLTSGYLPYFDGANLNNTSLYFTGGNIGIGTTNPSYKLDIANSTLNRGFNIVMDTSTSSFTYGGYIDITNATGSAIGQIANVNASSGQSSTGFWAEVAGGTSAYGSYINASSTNSFVIGTYSNAYAQSASAGDIYGGQFISESLGTSTAYGIYADAYASGTGQAWAGYFGSGNVYVENNIGVGTTNPQYALDVVGDIRIVSGSELYSYGSATLGSRTYTEDNYVVDGQTFTASIDALDQQVQNLSNGEAGMWQDQTGYINPINATSIVITDTGRLGIGTTAPNNPLSVIGNANITGNVGIGTTEVSTYALNVAGSANVNSLYIGGTQVSATATELNILSGATLSTAELNYLDNSTVTNGGIVFGDGSNFTQDAANFFWDNSSNYLGIGTTAPSTTLDLFGTTAGLQLSYDANNYGKFTIGNDGTLTLAGVSGGGSLTNIARFSTTGVDIDVPTSFNAAGDVSIANDLQFTNQTASYIKTLGPLTIEAGESYESNNLKLKTYNSGRVLLDAAGGVAFSQAQNWDLDVSTTALNFESGLLNLDTSNSRMGIGTTAPGAKLDVSGTGWIRGGTGVGLYVASSGYVGIGTTAPVNMLTVTGNADITGNVGIGNTSPTYKLDVSGTGRFTGDLRLTGAFYDTSASAGSSTNILTSTGTGTSWSTIAGLSLTTGTGTDNYLSRWNSAGTGLENGALVDNSTTGVTFNIDSSNNVGIGGTAANTIPNLYVGADGNVGIGTTAPAAKFDVAGTGWIRGGTGNSGGLFVNGSGQVGIGLTNQSNVLSVLSSTSQASQFAISETPSTTPISIASFKYNSGTALGNISGLSVAGTQTFYMYATASKNLGFGANSSTTPHLLINTSGYVGIGTTAPGYQLDVAGDINTSSVYKIGGTTVLSASSSSENVLVGLGTGITAPSGATQLTLVGQGAGSSINSISADQNTFVGAWAGTAVTSGSQNVIIGNDTAGSLTTGSNNFIGGAWAGVGSTASYNVSLGYSAGGSNISGNDNVMLGAYADVTSAGNYSVVVGSNAQTAYSSSIALGYSASPTASNQLLIGGNNTNGYINDAYFGRGVVSATPNDITFNATGGSGTDITGANMILAGGKGTGNADGGDILFKTSDAGATGTTLQSLTEKMRLTDEGYLGIGTTAPGNSLAVVGNANITGNVGIGTTEVSTYALNVAGSANVNSLYIGGTQVSATATELNILSGATLSTAELNYLDNSTVTNGGIVFGNGSNFTQDAANFFWNDSSNYLGIGTTAPSATLDLFGTTAALQMTYDANNYGKFTIGSDGTLTLAGVSSGGTLTNIARFATTGIDIDVPTSFNATGDVSIANDLQFTNQTASYIKTLGPLTIESGELFENNNLTLKTYGTGNIVFDLTGTGSGWLTGTDTSLVFDTRTSTDTDFWMGIIDDAGNDDDDIFAIGDGDIKGTNPFLTINTSGSVGIGTTSPIGLLNIVGSTTPFVVKNTGWVGIGTTNPTAPLDVINSSGAQLSLGYSDSVKRTITTQSGGALFVDTGNASNLFRVGDISLDRYMYMGYQNTTSVYGSGANNTGFIGHSGSRLIVAANEVGINDTLRIGTSTTDYISLQNVGSGNLAIDGTGGSVGIGTTSPAAKLDVAGTGWIRGGTGNTTGLFVNSSGSVGIGTTSPTAELHIEDTASDALLYLKGGAGVDGSGVWSVSDNQSILRADTYDDTNESRVSLNRARGTAASPTALQAGDMIGAIEFNGYDTGLSDSGAIQVIASGEHGTAGDSTDAPGDMLFLTTPDGSGTLSERVRITSEGNMGIGTSAPAAGLDVATTAWLRGATGGTGLYVNASSSVGIGTTNPSGLLQIAGSSLNSVFASTGYLGIGTTNASTPLEVFGTSAAFQLSYDASNYGKFTIGSDGTLTLAGVSAGGSLTNIARFSTAAVNIDVPTSFNAAGDVSVAYDLYFTNQTASYIKSDGPLSIVSGEAFENNDLTIETYGTGDIILKANSGNIWADGTTVGIGTTAPARALHVLVGSTAPPVRFQDSDGYCEIDPTSTTWSCTSDATLKKDVETLSNIYNLEKLNQLRPVSFRWKTQQDADKRYGLIAQEVEQFFPEFVQTDENGLKSVSYGSFTPILISAVQQQQLKISAQETSLAALSEELDLTVNEETGVVTSSLINTLAQNTQDIEDRTVAIEGEVEALAQKDSQIETRLTTIEDRLNALEQASASASLNTLNERVGFLEQLFTGIQASGSADLSTYLADLINGQVLGLQSDEATLSALTVSGDTNVNNLGVTGEISNGILTINGFDDTLATPAATISTLGGSLQLQHLGLGDIEFMAGKSKINTDGNFIISEGDFVIETGVIKGNDQFRGIDVSAGLGSTYLDIDFNTVKDTNEYAVNVTPSWLTNIAVINKRTDGFRIQFSTPAPLNGTVDWMIIE